MFWLVDWLDLHRIWSPTARLLADSLIHYSLTRELTSCNLVCDVVCNSPKYHWLMNIFCITYRTLKCLSNTWTNIGFKIRVISQLLSLQSLANWNYLIRRFSYHLLFISHVEDDEILQSQILFNKFSFTNLSLYLFCSNDWVALMFSMKKLL